VDHCFSIQTACVVEQQGGCDPGRACSRANSENHGGITISHPLQPPFVHRYSTSTANWKLAAPTLVYGLQERIANAQGLSHNPSFELCSSLDHNSSMGEHTHPSQPP
jgi:hypothetical protein